MKKLFFNLLITSLVVGGGLTELRVSAQRMATITGALSYPTDAGLPNMIVCAEPVNSKSIHCTNKRVVNRRSGKATYKLTVPAGTYHVFATVVNGEDSGEGFRGYKAYYSEFVKCGLSVDCPSHEPIKVTLRAGQTLANIDPADWYADN
ncbi:MAG TPA: hypothetical protein VGB61_11755 [Pyrinomonadaceae bacterium]|jgi:hypothetical protein